MSMNICIRPHCAIRSHKHDTLTYASFLGLSEHYQQVALLYFSREREIKNIQNHKVLSQPFCETKTFVGIIRGMMLDVETELCIEMRKLLVIYIYYMLNTVQALKIRAWHAALNLTMRRKMSEFLAQTDDKNFIETLSSLSS